MYVYRHRRLDDNSIFYIGIGSRKDRAYTKNSRNNYWKNITNKTEYEVEIIADNLSNESAKELEIFLIKLYGRRDLGLGNLVNMTDGGDYIINLSLEARSNIGKAVSLRNNLPFYKNKLIERNKSFIWTKEIIDKANNTKRLNNSFFKNHSEESKLKIGKSKSKKVINTETGEIYESAKQCALENGMLHKTLINKLSGHRSNNTNFIYLENYDKQIY